MRNLPKKPTETKGPKKRKQWNVSERFVIRRKKNLSFVAKLTQVSTAETQPNPTKKTRRNVSKRFLKKIQKNSILKLTQEPRYPIEIGGNLQKKSKSEIETKTYKKRKNSKVEMKFKANNLQKRKNSKVKVQVEVPTKE